MNTLLLKVLFWVLYAILLLPLLPILHAWNRVEVIRGRKMFPWVLGALVAQTISVSMLVLAIFWHTSIGENHSLVRSVVIGALLAVSSLSMFAALWRSEIRFDLGFRFLLIFPLAHRAFIALEMRARAAALMRRRRGVGNELEVRRPRLPVEPSSAAMAVLRRSRSARRSLRID